MKDGLTNVDVYVLARELTPKRFSKIVRIDGGYKLKFSGGADILYVHGKYLIPTSYVIEAGRPDNLAVMSRKLLGNARVESFAQINFDRILRFRTERGSVIVELFGGGNIILTDGEGIIRYALVERDWRDRSIRRSVMYNPPPPPRIRPDMSPEEFSGVFTGKDVVRSLVRAGLPPIYAEELCIIADTPKNTPVSELTDTKVRAIYDAFQTLVHRMNNPHPVVVFHGDEIVDILPFPISRYESDDFTLDYKNTLSEALDVLTPHILTIPENEESDRSKKKDIRDLWARELKDARTELETLEAMLNDAYSFSADLLAAMEMAKSGKTPPESIGSFRLKKLEGNFLVYDYSPD